jgi:hypothetical protein
MKYEYKLIKIKGVAFDLARDGNSASHEAELNRWGDARWEVVQIISNNSYDTMYLLKRNK